MNRMARVKPVIAFPKKRFLGVGTKLLTEADIELRRCPACRGTGEKKLADLQPFTRHTHRQWACDLCAGIGSIATSEATYRDLCQHYA
jgi:DnaJ-class molecular chaperone